jgi:hypothetical protein
MNIADSEIQQQPQQKEIMDWKKFCIAFFAAFGFIFVFGFIWYGTLMNSAHQEVSTLFRPKPDFPWLILGHIVMAFFLTLLCAKFVPAGGPGTCALLGLFVALVYVGAHLITFAVQPIVGLERGRFGAIRGRRSNHWRDLQAQFTRDNPGLNV